MVKSSNTKKNTQNIKNRKNTKRAPRLLGKPPSRLSTEGLTMLRTDRFPDRIINEKGDYMFQLEKDGNIVLYELTDKIHNLLWQSNTHQDDTDKYSIVLEEDGNLVAYNGSKKYWESKSNASWSSWVKGHGKRYGPYQLTINDYGEVHLKNRYELSLWTIPYGKTPARQKADAELYAERLKEVKETEARQREAAASYLSQVALIPILNFRKKPNSVTYMELISNGFNRLESDGNDRISKGPCELRIYSDGNIVFQRDGHSVWESNTHRSRMNSYSLVMQNDGNLVAYENGTTPYWATNTNDSSDFWGPFTLSFVEGPFSRMKLTLTSRIGTKWTVG
jgi:hypothetical protein